MAEGWAYSTVADIAAPGAGSISIGPFGSSLKSELYSASGVPVLRGQNLGDGLALDENDLVYVPAAIAYGLKHSIVHDGDLVFPHRGAIGRVGLVAGRDYLLSSSMMKLTVDTRFHDPRYFFYYFRGPGKSELLTRASTVGTPGIGQPLQSLRGIPVQYPHLSQQRAIAEVLGALDDKIAANTRTLGLISNLLSARFDHAVARDGRLLPLADAARFHNRRRIPLSANERDARPGSVPYYGASGAFGTIDQALFDEPLVLVGEDGSVINDDDTPVTQYIWGPAWVNNHAHVLTGSSTSTELLYLAVRRANVATLVTGAVQPKVSMGNLKRLLIELPHLEALPAIETMIGSQFELHRSLTTESTYLAATRDALLPALISGKLRVRDAERIVSTSV